jgi:hypothetical protein
VGDVCVGEANATRRSHEQIVSDGAHPGDPFRRALGRILVGIARNATGQRDDSAFHGDLDVFVLDAGIPSQLVDDIALQLRVGPHESLLVRAAIRAAIPQDEACRHRAKSAIRDQFVGVSPICLVVTPFLWVPRAHERARVV